MKAKTPVGTVLERSRVNTLTGSSPRAIRLGMPTLHDELRARIETFATELTTLVRTAALESVSAALGGSALGAPVQVATAKQGPARPKKAVPPAPATRPSAAGTSATATPATKAPASKKLVAPKRARGAKRTPAALAQLTERLADYVKAHPGVRMETMATALTTPSNDSPVPGGEARPGQEGADRGQEAEHGVFPGVTWRHVRSRRRSLRHREPKPLASTKCRDRRAA